MPGNDANTKLLLHANGGDGVKSAFAHLRLEDNTDDGTGANAVTNIGTPTYTAGHLNNALTLDGSTDALNVDALEVDIDTDTTGSISAWFNPANLSNNMTIFSLGDTDADRFFRMGLNNSGQVEVSMYDGVDDWYHLSTALGASSTWYHIVVVQDGVSPKIYLNGSDITNLTITTDTTQWFAGLESSGPIDNGRIGCANNNSGGNSRFFNGQIDDFRYFKAVLTQTEIDTLYNSGSGTENSIILDASGGSHTAVQTFNDAQLDTTTKKWGTAALTFDGTGDYVTIPDSADWDIVADKTDNQTIDMQLKLDVPGAAGNWIAGQSEDGSNLWRLYHANTYGIYLGIFSGLGTVFSDGANLIAKDAEIEDTDWHHLAVIKSGAFWGIYLDGTQYGYNFQMLADSFASPLYIGSVDGTTNYFDGNIDEFRVQADNYFSAAPNSFPAAPLIIYGGGLKQSYALLNGSSQYVSVPSHADFGYGTGDLTIDMWFYYDGTTFSGQNFWMHPSSTTVYSQGYTNASGIGWSIQNGGTSEIAFYIPCISDVTVGWHHVAWVRNGTDFNIYLDGNSYTRAGTYTSSYSMPTYTSTFNFGRYWDTSTATNYFGGSLDEIRVSKGIARWTSDFTPPTSQYISDANTSLLIHFDQIPLVDSGNTGHTVTDGAGRRVANNGYGDEAINGNTADIVPLEFSHMVMEDNTDTGTGANAVTNIGTPTYTSGKIGNALTLDGSTDALGVDALATDIASDTAGTFSFWIYPNALEENTVIGCGDTDAYNVFRIGIRDSNGYIEVDVNNAAPNNGVRSNTGVTVSAWNHVVVTCDGTNIRIYINGTESATTVLAGTDGNWLSYLSGIDNGRIGCRNFNSGGNTLFFDGQIDDFRYYQNQALAPFQINKIYNAGTGTEQPITALSFNGSSDSFTVTDTSGTDYDVYANSTDTWTLDAWVYITDLTTDNNAIMEQSDSTPDSNNRWNFWVGTDGAPRIFGRNSGGIIGNAYGDSTIEAVSENTWAHVTAIKHKDILGVYVNGVQTKGQYLEASGDTFTGSLIIGTRNTFSDNYFAGYMEQVQITRGNKFGVVPMPEPFCHMKLENNTDDGSGANAVSDIGTPTYTSGKIGNALTLNGTDQALNVNALMTDVKSDTTGTISVWVKPTDDSTTRTIFMLGEEGVGGSQLYFDIESDDQIKFHCGNSAGGNDWRLVVNSAITPAVWTHIVIVQDGVSPVFYVNGVKVEDADRTLTDYGDVTAWFSTGSATFDLGRIGVYRTGSNSSWFDGQIDDFRYYQNQALNATQVAQIYNEGTGSELTYPVGLTVPTAVLTQDTITVPTEEYAEVAVGRSQAIIIA